MTDRRSGNVWRTPSSTAKPTQRWPGRPDGGQLPTQRWQGRPDGGQLATPSADTAAPRRPPPGSLQQTLRRARADLVLWGGLALGALLLLLIAFALWDRPVDESPTVRTTVVSTSETSNAP
jgi:hypothetical protein